MNRLWKALNDELKTYEPDWNRLRRREELKRNSAYWRKALKIVKNKNHYEESEV